MKAERKANQILHDLNYGKGLTTTEFVAKGLNEFANDIIMTNEEMMSLMATYPGLDQQGYILTGLKAYRDWQLQKLKT